MNTKTITLALLLGVSSMAMAQQSFTVKVKNPMKVARQDQPVTISLKKYGEDVKRAVVTCDGKEIPSQLDDLNEDAYNDELFFLADLDKKETKTYKVTLYNDGSQAKYESRTFAEIVLPSKNKKLAKNQQDIYLRSLSFDKKTKDRYHYVHSHGVCFESDLIAMRIYFDDRQTIDLYGKTHKGLVIYDTQFYPSDEQLANGSGDDVLWVGNTYGLGALRGWDGTQQLLFTDMKRQEQRVITEGPLRSIVEIEDRGWVPSPGKKPVTALLRYTIYGGHRDFDVDVTFDRNVDGYEFATGLINIKNSTEYSDHKGLRGCYGSDWPTGKDDGKHKLETVGLGIDVPATYLAKEVAANSNDYTLVVKAKDQKLSYRLAYTSANENYGFSGEKEWYQWLKDWKEQNANPIEIVVE